MNQKDAVNKLLGTGRDVFILLDPRHHQCNVPACFKKQDKLGLQFGLNHKTTKDLKTDKGYALTVSLRFNGQYYWCNIPWESITQAALMGENSGYVWEPGKETVRFNTLSSDSGSKNIVALHKSERPYLRLVR